MRDIPAELLNKLVSQHQTKANASDPRMSVTVARAKTTVMDTTYFTTETIRSKTGLGDISLAGRRQVPYGTPNRIYEIHVDEGLVKTAIREYPDRLKDGWKDQFTLGPGSSVAIAFEGNWQRYRKYWRLITSEKPYIFWVDDVGDLWTQLWDEQIKTDGYWKENPPTESVQVVENWDKTWMSNTSINSSGVLTVFEGCKTTNKITVVEGKTYFFDNGDFGNYGRLRWVDVNNNYIYHQDLGSNGGSAVAPSGAYGVYFFYSWNVETTPSVTNEEVVTVQLEPTWIEESYGPLKLASDVVKVRAIRAWKNVGYQDKDQGIVVGYIKTDGSIYYRNYSQQLDETYLWEYERKIDEFPYSYVSLNMFITNDYRMGFVAERNNGTIEWAITHRNWAGMASPDEYLKSGIRNIKMNVFPIEFMDSFADDEHITSGIKNIFFNAAEPIYPEVISASNQDEYTITLKFSHPIDFDLSNVKDAFTIKDVSETIYTIISSHAGIDQSEIVFNTSNFNAASSGLIVVYDRSILELDSLNQGSRFAIESFNFNFIPELVPPEGYDLENIAVSLPIYFEPKFIYYKTANNGSEYVTAGVVNIGFVVTKVGSNPL